MRAPLEVIEIHDEKSWEEFCLAAVPSTFLQSWHWGEVHRTLGRKIWRLGVVGPDGLVAIGLLVKQPSRVGDHLYCPRGPLCEWSDPAVLEAFVARASQIASAERCAFVRLDPLLSDSYHNRALFAGRGFVRGLVVVQAEHVCLLPLDPSESELLARMRQGTRYLVRQEPARGIRVSVSSADADARAFVDLLYETGHRRRFVPLPRRHYLTVFDILSRKGLAEIFVSRRDEDVLAMALIVYYADTAYYLYAASQARQQGSFGYLLQWEAIKRAKRRGCRLYNFGGIVKQCHLSRRHPWYGFSLFKRGFGGFELSYLRTQDLPISWNYWVYRYFEHARVLVRRVRRRVSRSFHRGPADHRVRPDRASAIGGPSRTRTLDPLIKSQTASARSRRGSRAR